MEELSLHILDIVQNSIAAESDQIVITVVENSILNQLIIEVVDNGKGIPEEMIKNVSDPFVTSRKNRRVGLGISLFKAAAEICEGKFSIESKVGRGTKVRAQFKADHIDRVPLGNMAETIVSLVASSPDVEFEYIHVINDKRFEFNTKTIRKHIEGISIDNIDVLLWIKDYIQQGIMEVSE